MDPNKTIPTTAQMTAEQFRADRKARAERDAAGRALDLKLAVMDEIDRAVEAAQPARPLVAIPASPEDFRRANDAARIRNANGFTFVPLSEVRIS